MGPASSETPSDHPDVSIHPPLFYLAALALSYALNKFEPLPIFNGLAPRMAGLALVVAGLSIVASGRRIMKAHGTNINPTRPTMTIIQTGPYRYSRNPLYLSLTTAYCGFGLLMNTWWPFILLPLVLLPMHFLVVLREERYLKNKFGQAYQAYCAAVRRYL